MRLESHPTAATLSLIDWNAQSNNRLTYLGCASSRFMAPFIQNSKLTLEIPNHRVERVDEMTLSYILRAIQAYATTAEGRQGPLGDSLYGRKAYEAIARCKADNRALVHFDY